MTDTPAAPSPMPEIGQVTLAELRAALGAGWRDFRAAPLYGLFFSVVYVVAGIVLIWVGAGTLGWTLTLSLGFPLVAPFAAVGLYEVSRRLEAGEALVFSGILGVVADQRHRQIPWIGAILILIFLFWSFFAHMLFAAFVGPAAILGGVSWEWLLTPQGLLLAALELLSGGAVALLTFAVTVVSLPLLMEKEFDFVTAMLISIRTFSRNRVVLLVWAGLIAALTIVAMIPAFLGLFVVLPVLGHATWHLYRRAIYHPVA